MQSDLQLASSLDAVGEACVNLTLAPIWLDAPLEPGVFYDLWFGTRKDEGTDDQAAVILIQIEGDTSTERNAWGYYSRRLGRFRYFPRSRGPLSAIRFRAPPNGSMRIGFALQRRGVVAISSSVFLTKTSDARTVQVAEEFRPATVDGRLLLTVDSRVADTAGLMFIDIADTDRHFVSLETGARQTRNGYRGGALDRDKLFLCTSHEVHVLEISWPRGSDPSVRLLERFRRPEWTAGGRANADLHAVAIDRDGTLLIANSYMDCIDRLGRDGRLLERTYLWDLSTEIWDLAFEKDPAAADLCHLNHFAVLDEGLLLTLGNLNGTRRGALMNGEGALLVRDLAFPHDGLFDAGDLIITETGTGRITIFEGARLATLTDCPRMSIDVTATTGTNDTEPSFWLRGVTVLSGYIVVACSQKGERILTTTDEALQTHLRVFDRHSHEFKGHIGLPRRPEAPVPVVYSLIPMA
jgi:hypothetical protein